MLTEDEAKTMWCPMYRCAPHGTNADADGGRRDTCVASRCMMWRKVDQVGIGPDGKKRDRDMDGRTKWIDRGYCGLAGIPRNAQ